MHQSPATQHVPTVWKWIVLQYLHVYVAIKFDFLMN